MEKRDLRKSLALKITAFMTLPLLFIILMWNIFVIAYGMYYPEVIEGKSYFETESFQNKYKNRFTDCTYPVKEMKSRFTAMYGKDELGFPKQRTLVGENEVIYYPSYQDSNFIYLVINPDNNEAYTNIEQTGRTDSIGKIKQILENQKIYWNYIDGKVISNIENLQEDDLKYNYIENGFKSNNNYVYTALKDDMTAADSFKMESKVYQIIGKSYKTAYIMAIVSTILLIAEMIYLSISVGHKKDEEKISLNILDNMPIEIYTLGAIITEIILGTLTVTLASAVNENLLISIPFLVCIYLILLSGLYFLGGYIKRIKANSFFKNSITYKVVRFFTKKVKKVYENIVYNINTSIKLLVVLGAFVLISLFLIMLIRDTGFISIWFLAAFWIYCYYFILSRIKEFEEIKKATKTIYEGNTDVRLNESELKGTLKEMAVYLNDIAGGFSNAIEESLKSERLKTELITNVSHDIKTPLTSIINYVDLLKREDIKDEKVKEYIEVLDSKSKRLKKLIEDLVEASKASSGNIKLKKERLKVKELINQVTGEFEDKLQEKDLNVVTNFPEEEVYILADSRYLYRVMENLYSNVSKYAQENSRVYVDVKKKHEKVIISIKNISKEALNISVEELMQRFVRGDKSRNTEGSGLGLSIAQSLTELQGGKFDIYLDGDLFKVTLEF